MKINKVKKDVKSRLRYYSGYDMLILKLKEEKNQSSKRDVNSYIRSKNNINRSTEIQAIKNINIDTKINEIEKWQELINYVIEEAYNDYDNKGKALKYRYKDNLPIETIAEILNTSETAVYNWINECVLEIAIIAVDKKMIKIETF